jgi:beta-glucosidase
VLLGQVNPSGHLPFTWYQGTDQLPEITDYRLSGSGKRLGRTYLYFHGKPTYPFGHGLSYTTFRYSDLTVDRSRIAPEESVEVSVEVTNTGKVTGRDAVQLYVATPKSPDSAERPITRLRRFQQVSVDPQQTKTVTFTLPATELAFFDDKAGTFQVDHGRYELRVSNSSATEDIQQRDSITVSGSWKPLPKVLTVTPHRSDDPVKGIAGQVSYPRGVTIDPRPTLALDDQSLLGFTSAGNNRPLPTGMTVQYHSNRPEVVAIDGSGTIRTQQTGVATITASLKVAGRTISEDFVVQVHP